MGINDRSSLEELAFAFPLNSHPHSFADCPRAAQLPSPRGLEAVTIMPRILSPQVLFVDPTIVAPGNDARHLSFKDLWVNQNSSTGLSSYCKTADRIYGVSLLQRRMLVAPHPRYEDLHGQAEDGCARRLGQAPV